jgi:hypothetical protein
VTITNGEFMSRQWRRKLIPILFGFLLLSSVLLTSIPVVKAAGTIVISDATAQELAERFKPVLNFEKEEKMFPVNIEYYLQFCNLNQSLGSDSTVVVIPAPLTPDLLVPFTDPSSNYYLDNILGTIRDSNITDRYQADESGLNYTIYCHVTDDGTNIAVQYWFFYVFNQGELNDHEGDWEMMQVIVDPSSMEPVKASFSQHNYGQQISWAMAEKEGDHLKVFVARGSHACYVRPFQGTLEFARDSVGDNGKILKPDDSRYQIVMMGEKTAPMPGQEWINFAGFWGDYGNTADSFMGRRGPPGPAFRTDGQMWTGLAWGDSLMLVSQDFLTLEWTISNFVLIYLGIVAISVAIIAYRIIRRIKKKHLKSPYARLFEFKGDKWKVIGNLLAIAGVIIGLIGAFLPYYHAELNAQTGDFDTGGWTDLVTIDGLNGIQVNTLDPRGGMIQIGSLAIPFAILVLTSLAIFIFATIGATKWQAGRKYLTRGISLLLPLILVMVFISMIGSLLQYVPAAAQMGGSPEVAAMTDVLSKQPLGGEMSVDFPGYGFAQMVWGIGIGAELMAVGAVLLIVGAIMQFVSKDTGKLPSPAPTPEQQPPQEQQVQP